MALLAVLWLCPSAYATDPRNARTVVLLTPENTVGSPAGVLINQGLRTTFAAASSEEIQIRNEYLDLSRFEDPRHERFLVEYLRQKYAGQKVDLVMAALGSALDFALANRAEIFPGVPVVFIAVDEQELQTRALPADVIGVPITRDLAARSPSASDSNRAPAGSSSLREAPISTGIGRAWHAGRSPRTNTSWNSSTSPASR